MHLTLMVFLKLLQELGSELSAERERLQNALRELQQEYEQVKADLTSKLDHANQEVC